MRRFKHILRLTKKISKTILNGGVAEKSVFSDFDNEDEFLEVLQRTVSKEEKEQRDIKIKQLKKTQKSDWKTIEAQIAGNKNYLDYRQLFKIASVIIIVVASAFYFNHLISDLKKPLYAEDNIVLKHHDGTYEVIAPNGTKKIYDSTGSIISEKEEGVLSYASIKVNSKEELQYNELTVPYGKTFKLMLSDSTTVYLNSGTSLKYPVRFLKGKDRLVYLTGEAFFEVTKNKTHPFIVKSRDLDVKVLGTKFNVSSYPEDWSINTVLVEGSVKIYQNNTNSLTNNNSTTLKPGHKAFWMKNKKKLGVKEVRDTAIYTSWVNGKVVFKHLKFENIIRKLERHYNVTITNFNQELSDKRFTASFDTETIEQVFKSFNASFKIKYEIKGNKITIY